MDILSIVNKNPSDQKLGILLTKCPFLLTMNLMKKVFAIFFSILLLSLSVGFQTALAKDMRTSSSRAGNTVVIAENEVINSDYFVGGDTVKILGTVNGDLYAGGGTVIIDGIVNGDVLAAGGTVTINGTVSQNVRIAGGQLNVNGDVGRNITAAGGNIDVSSSATVNGSLVVVGGNLNIDAPINGNLYAGVGNLTLSNAINGNVEVGVGTATLTDGAKVNGNFDYWSEEDASIAQGASISGTVTKQIPSSNFDQEKMTADAGKLRDIFGGTAKVISIFSTIIVGLLFFKLFPNFSEDAVTTLVSRPWASVSLGFVVLFGAPILMFFVLITIIGIPISLIVFAMYFIYLYVAKFIVLIWAGKYFSKKLDKKMNPYWTFILGLVVYTVVTFIPIVGGLTRFFTLLFGLGALVIASRESYQKALTNKVI
jgi:cytoskeletal protein CcmA (bactofilin family)